MVAGWAEQAHWVKPRISASIGHHSCGFQRTKTSTLLQAPGLALPLFYSISLPLAWVGGFNNKFHARSGSCDSND